MNADLGRDSCAGGHGYQRPVVRSAPGIQQRVLPPRADHGPVNRDRRLEGSESQPEGLSPGDPGYNPRHHGEHYLHPRVAELVGLVSGERLAWFSESCGPLPDLGAAAARIHGLTKLGVLGILGV